MRNERRRSNKSETVQYLVERATCCVVLFEWAHSQYTTRNHISFYIFCNLFPILLCCRFCVCNFSHSVYSLVVIRNSESIHSFFRVHDKLMRYFSSACGAIVLVLLTRFFNILQRNLENKWRVLRKKIARLSVSIFSSINERFTVWTMHLR